MFEDDKELGEICLCNQKHLNAMYESVNCKY